MSSVYVMSVPSGYKKIGIAEDPSTRKVELQTGNPEPISLIYAADVGFDGVDAREIERDMHRMLAHFWTRGEWFEVPLETIQRAFKIAWGRAVAPNLIARWERMCWRPAFVARHAVSLSNAYMRGYRARK